MNKINLVIEGKGEACWLVNKDNFSEHINIYELEEAIKRERIVFGIKESLFEEIEDGKHAKSQKILVARQKPPSKGNDGYIEYLISDESEVKINVEDQSVDFYETGLIKTLEEGTKLIKIYPPTKGEDGKNIFGEELEGLLGKEVRAKQFVGEGTGVDNKYEYIVALRDGIYKKSSSGVVSIVDEIVINGDLDFSVGNIETTSVIFITGDIFADFVCKTTTSIHVDGVIDDAIVEAGDSIICKSGILSGNKTIIAKNTIRTKYVNERNITCGSLYAEGLIYSSTIKSEDEIEAMKIVGGHASARNKIIASEIGNKHFSDTKIEVGIDYCIVDKMNEEAKKISSLAKDLEKKEVELKKLEKSYEVYSDKIRQLTEHGTPNPKLFKKVTLEAKVILNSLNNMRERVDRERSELSEKKKYYSELAEKVEVDNCEIVVTGTVYPNTHVRMKLNGRYHVNSVLTGVRFKLDENNQVKIYQL